MLNHGQHITGTQIANEVSSWSPDKFAVLCNAVSWETARRQHMILPSFTEHVYVPDHGIDGAYVLLNDNAGSSSILAGGWNVLQFKKRDCFAQDRNKLIKGLEQELKKTLRDSTLHGKKKYIGALQDIYEREKKRPARYLLFTNIDLTDKDKYVLKASILLEYEQPDTVQVVVYGAGDLGAFLNNLPHLRLAFFATIAFRTWAAAWEAHVEEGLLKNTAPIIGRGNELRILQSYLDDPDIKVIILSGFHGIGKSRLVLEATKHLQTAVIEALDPASLTVSDLRAAVSPDGRTIIIIENPEKSNVEAFVRHTLGSKDLKIVITLPVTEHISILNDRIKSMVVEPLSETQAYELLKSTSHSSNSDMDFGIESWIISQAGGNPGNLLTAARAKNLRKRTTDFVKDVALAYQDTIQREFGEQAIACLRILSLLIRTDIRDPSHHELLKILPLFSNGIQLNELLNMIDRLVHAGVVRLRGKYAEIVLSLFANHLAAQIVKGRFEELSTLFVTLKRPARFRLLERLSEVNGDEVALFWDDLFSLTGLFVNFSSACAHLELLQLITGAVPLQVARLLENGLREMSYEDRCLLPWDVRSHLVSILKELLFHRNTSRAALWCFLLLAESESTTHLSSSLEYFYDCFHPFQPQCPLPLEDRLDILTRAVAANASLPMRKIGLKALMHALSTAWSFSLYESKGPEPLESPPNMTWQDIWNYWEALVDILIGTAQSDEQELAEIAQSSLLDVLTQYTDAHPRNGLARFCQIVQSWRIGLLPLSISNLSQALLRIQLFLNHKVTNNNGKREMLQEALEEVTKLLGELEASDFSVRLKRWVGPWASDQNNEQLRSLVTEVIQSPELLTEDLFKWLVSEEAKQNWSFFYALGEQDTNHLWKSKIEKIGATKEGEIAFSQYLSGFSQVHTSFVSSWLEELTGERTVTDEAIALATASMPADLNAVKRIELLLDEKRATIATKRLRSIYGFWANDLKVDEYFRLLSALLRNESDYSSIIVRSLNIWLETHSNFNEALTELAQQCLEQISSIGNEEAYECDALATKLAEYNLERGFDLLEKLLNKLIHLPSLWNPLSSYSRHTFWSTLYNTDPRRVLCIPLMLATREKNVLSTITWELLGIINQEESGTILIEFANENLEQAKVVCACIAATKPGFWPIAHAILRRYPTENDVRKLLHRAIIRTDIPVSVIMGIPSLAMQARLDAIQQVLVDQLLPLAERSWLRQIEYGLRAHIESFQSYEAEARTNEVYEAPDDPTAPERIWKLRQLLQEKKYDILRKSFSHEELLLLLPSLQLPECELASIKEYIQTKMS